MLDGFDEEPATVNGDMFQVSFTDLRSPILDSDSLLSVWLSVILITTRFFCIGIPVCCGVMDLPPTRRVDQIAVL